MSWTNSATELGDVARDSVAGSYTRWKEGEGLPEKNLGDPVKDERTHKQTSLKLKSHKESIPLMCDTQEDDNCTDMYAAHDYKLSSNYSGKSDKKCWDCDMSGLNCSERLEGFLGMSGQKDQEEFDSLDYDVSYNIPYKNQVSMYTKWTYMHIEVIRWILVCVIGILTGFVAFVIVSIIHTLVGYKYQLYLKVIEMTTKNEFIFTGLLVLLAFNVFFVTLAGILVALRPIAAGSGIPEIKCYLNGIKVPHVARIGTLIAKAVGVIFSVAGGLLVGKEGPMIHSGSIIGAGIPQFKSFILKLFRLPYHFFRSDRDKRDFVSSGAAAGVAAAFGAPIGGVLFSLEEGSSFWNQSLTWKTLFCSFSSTFTLNFLLTASERRGIGYLASPGLVDFGIFSKDRLWNAYHLLIFILIAAVGGLLGALFNSLNLTLTKYRIKYLAKRKFHSIWRIVEVILIAMVTTFTIYLASTFLGTCVLEPQAPQNTTTFVYVGDEKYDTRDLFCPGHDPTRNDSAVYFNDMATLMLQSQESGIKHLFHRNTAFTLPTLLILFICYFFLACWTYGSGVPSGLFIPTLLIGATYGRFLAIVFGYLARASPHHFGWLISLYPGTYALIGAASFLGGVVRMTISLTVILIETTNEIEYGLPIVLTLMVAKWVGDFFNDGIYDAHIKLRKTPFLEWESPHQLDKLIAADVMNSSSKKLSYLNPISEVGQVEDVLRNTSHSAFLVVTPCRPHSIPIKPKTLERTNSRQNDEHSQYETFSLPENLRMRASSTVSTSPSISPHEDILVDEEGRVLLFRGLILRHQLTVLLKNKVFFDRHETPASQKDIDHKTLTKDYPRFPDIDSIDISDEERKMLIDLSCYMNSNPYTIYKDAPLPQVFTLFRTMGLRHLPVIEESGLVAGIITRHDLTHNKLHELRHRKKMRQRAATVRMSSPETVDMDYQPLKTTTDEHP